MDVDPKLLEILVCPLTKSRLIYDRERQELRQQESRSCLSHPRRHSRDAAGRSTAALGKRAGMSAAGPWPAELRLNPGKDVLKIRFDTARNVRLRRSISVSKSPSAEVQGHGPLERTFVPGKRHVKITALEPIGHYASRIIFDDGHDSGLYSWSYLLELGREHEEKWQAYLEGSRARV
jgi:DUF971 family protein